MKTILKACALSACLLATTPVLWAESISSGVPLPPAQPLEQGGTLSDIRRTDSTVIIDGKTYLVTTQTRILVSDGASTQTVHSLADIKLDKAQVFFALDGKGQLTTLQIQLPPNTKIPAANYK